MMSAAMNHKSDYKDGSKAGLPKAEWMLDSSSSF